MGGSYFTFSAARFGVILVYFQRGGKSFHFYFVFFWRLGGSSDRGWEYGSDWVIIGGIMDRDLHGLESVERWDQTQRNWKQR
jgi:hypothetical protein